MHETITETLGRRDFLVRLGRGAAAGAACLNAGALGQTLIRARARPAAVPFERAHHMVVYGDSLPWGQGLEDASKYSTLVRQWLVQRLGGEKVVQWTFAHSGAVIYPNSAEDAKPPLPNEVPYGYPSIMAQIRLGNDYMAHHPLTDPDHAAPVRPENVSFVLVDGGINDVESRSILTMDPTIIDPESWVRKLARERCVERMGTMLLPLLLRTYPNALIIVTGYYSIVSEATHLGDLESFLRVLGVVGKFGDFLITEGVRRKLARQCAAFSDETTRGLRDVVANAQPLAVIGTPVASPTATGVATTVGKGVTLAPPPRASFVDFTLAPDQCFGAPNTMLWGIPAADPLAAARHQACNTLGISVDHLVCFEASVGHPNPAGAKLYADRISARLDCVLPASAAGATPLAARTDATISRLPRPGCPLR